MTPEEAREHLAWPEDKDHPKVRVGSGRTWFEVQAGESHPYWNRLPDTPYEDAVMYAAARAALATLAGMREEWGAERQVRGRWVRIVFALNTLWTDDRAIAESAVDDCRDLGLPARLVRRYVTTPEEA